MDQQVILLRGINVAGHGMLPMKELSALLVKLGGKNIQTYIQSGNVVLEGAVDPEIFSRAIFGAKGFLPQITACSAAEFAKIAMQSPFCEPDGKRLHIWFPMAEFTFDQAKADTLRTETEEIYVTADAIHLHAPGGIGRSKLAAKIEALAGVPCTARNMNTVNKLLEMLKNPA